jgi:hypothetical protein
MTIWEHNTITIDGTEVSKKAYSQAKERYYQQDGIESVESILELHDEDIDASTVIEHIRTHIFDDNVSEQSEREKQLDPTIGDTNVDNALDVSPYSQ